MTLAMQRMVKPKNKRTKKILQSKEPKAIENTKEVLFVRGTKCPERLLACMKDLHALKRPFSDFYGKKNDIRPFEDHTQLERFSKKEEKSLFVFGNTNKKRPNNLIFGRMYDYQLLDMIELGVAEFSSLSDFKNEKIPMGTKPCLQFSGQAWERSPEMQRLKSLFLDFFRGPEVSNVRLAGLAHVIQLTAAEEGGKVFFRSYRALLKKSSTPRVPRVELEEIGPSIDFVLRRSHLASDDLYKTACKQVKNVHKEKKVKNVEKDEFGTTLGKIHVPKLDVSKLQTRKMKGLKEDKAEKIAEKKAKAEKARKNMVEEVFNDEDGDNDDDEGEDMDTGDEEDDEDESD